MPISRFKSRILALAPHAITGAALISGLTSIRFAFEGRYDACVAAILIAVMLDGADGSAARNLAAESRFGAELDNLADFLSFGVTPGLFLYVWLLSDLGLLGWIGFLIYAGAAAIRLARYGAGWQPASLTGKRDFSGLPSPAAAVGLLLPYAIYRWFEPDNMGALKLAALICLLIAAALMVMKMPFPSAGRILSAMAGLTPALPLLLLAGLAAGACFAPFALLTMLSGAVFVFALATAAVTLKSNP